MRFRRTLAVINIISNNDIYFFDMLTGTITKNFKHKNGEFKNNLLRVCVFTMPVFDENNEYRGIITNGELIPVEKIRIGHERYVK
jgi:hypothetical protein